MQIIGHRGARAEAPENSLGGFVYLKNLGIRAVEFDVRQLAGGELVVIHDANVQRTALVNQIIEQSRRQNLTPLNIAAHWQQRWRKVEPLPLLKEVLDIVQDFRHIEVEIKAVASLPAAQRLIQTLLPQLTGLEQIATITSFDLQILDALQQQPNPFQRGLLVETPIGEHAIDIAQQYGCNRIGWKDCLASDEIIRATQQAGLKVSVWTVNDIGRAKHLQQLRIDGLITDCPKTMSAYL